MCLSPLGLRIAFSALSALMGVALLIGGAERISATAYAVVQSTGGTGVWGPLFLVSGVFTALSKGGMLRWALLSGGAGYAVLGTAFGIAAAASPVANFTAPVAYAWIAVMHVLASEQVVREGSRAWMPPLLRRSAAG